MSVVTLLQTTTAASAGTSASDRATTLVSQALVAQGGPEALRAIRLVSIHAMAVTNALEQSVRPDGPYFQEHEDLIETRRFDPPALRRQSRTRGYSGSWFGHDCWRPRTSMVVDGVALAERNGALAPASQAAVPVAEESLGLGPEQVLLTAAAAPDLRTARAARLHGYDHDVLAFTWRGAKVRLFLQPSSHMPAAVEVVVDRPLDMFWSGWGDVTTRTEWDAWTTEAGGVRYPRRWTTFANGLPLRSVMIDGLTLNPTPAPTFEAPSAVLSQARAAARPIASLPFSADRKLLVAPGVTLYPGAWNVVQVALGELTFVIEAPISGAYAAGVLRAVAQQRRKIAALVTTSDSWPHIAGIREYAASGVPLIALDLNRPIVERLLASPHALAPDALARNRRRPRIDVVTRPIELGVGSTAMRLIPLRTVTGERQMIVYWPAHKLLYTSDLLSLQGDSVWLPQARDELADVISRERLDVSTVFGMHYGPVAWAKVAAMAGPSSEAGPCQTG